MRSALLALLAALVGCAPKPDHEAAKAHGDLLMAVTHEWCVTSCAPDRVASWTFPAVDGAQVIECGCGDVATALYGDKDNPREAWAESHRPARVLRFRVGDGPWRLEPVPLTCNGGVTDETPPECLGDDPALSPLTNEDGLETPRRAEL